MDGHRFFAIVRILLGASSRRGIDRRPSCKY